MNIPNLIADRIEERYLKLDKETQRKIDDFYDNKSSKHQLQVIEKSKISPQTGDVFLFSPRKGLYFYGKVLLANIHRVDFDPFAESSHLVVLFKNRVTDLNMSNYQPDYDNLLIPPAIVPVDYWKRGYFYTLTNIPLTEEERTLDIGFYSISFRGNYFCKVTGEKMEREPQILGIDGITTLTGIATNVERELIIDPTLVEGYPLSDDGLEPSTDDNFLIHDADESFVSLDVSDPTVWAIATEVDDAYDVYLNGYGWESFLSHYWQEIAPELLDGLEMDPEASSIVFTYSQANERLLKSLYENLKQLIENPQLIYEYIKNNHDKIDWD
ncbi:Imm51 family immunity protein [Streptococcus sp. CSL10205-OR2]|uniref:Imm51 family immunity protein n=1 Tax=Streptococcus sp. CSL10205-OR2 TaxID=2980558 RepID=UPI0021D7FE45|nr:Imm51 family immunity protein [Streptococcus sp. CSL10205-OR2]MCU9533312.1 Imm51 family immunity protein [Streptococcus sp. CSL10205-OR2]